MTTVKIFGRVHFKNYSYNKVLIKEVKNADYILTEGVSHSDLLTWSNFNKEPLVVLFMALYYWVLKILSIKGKNDINSIRFVLNKENKKYNKDWEFCDADGKELINHFYKLWHLPLQISLFLIYSIMLYFLVGVSVTFIAYVVVIPIFLAGLIFVISTIKYRNDFPVQKVKLLINKGMNKILILYGKNHVKDLEARIPKVSANVIILN